MAGRSRLCSGPEEILLHIVEHLWTPDDVIESYYSRSWPDGQTIRFAKDQVLSLSQVNHLFRRLCLPLLYEHIVIRSTETNLPKFPFNLFRRAMERKPHLADLVRVIKVVRHSVGSYYVTSVFDSLPFLPKIKRIDFAPDINLDLDLLSVINSHPSLLTVHWETTHVLSFPDPLSLPHDALSRVLIGHKDLSGDSSSMELLWLFFAKLGLRVKDLTITGTTPPPFLSLTYPDLCRIFIDLPPDFSSDSPGSLEWFPSFLERHPQLEAFKLWNEKGDRRLPWEALKNVPIIKPLYDASQSRRLISSFSFGFIFISIELFWADIYVDLPQDLPKIIHLLGSLLPISKIKFRFRTREPHFLPINANEFASTFQENYKTLSWLTLFAVCQVLDLDSLSTDVELHIHNTRIEEDVLSDSRLRDRTKQLAQLTRILCAGLPRLELVDVNERGLSSIDDELDRYWLFRVLGDGRVKLITLC